ncbi:hypothetical protein SAMN00790413_04445 [Deinococcus hopiensis KR-140]|uniref:Uncharacterized protein n=1 Tax=Deinococcus hopiensis KR-140 TaxID=695939 RepID=A0A1W1UQY3_9DEIO|nr:hypothetical protein SAMN00790413_04445 [Deinococcus hopiensis KR-140]
MTVGKGLQALTCPGRFEGGFHFWTFAKVIGTLIAAHSYPHQVLFHQLVKHALQSLWSS